MGVRQPQEPGLGQRVLGQSQAAVTALLGPPHAALLVLLGGSALIARAIQETWNRATEEGTRQLEELSGSVTTLGADLLSWRSFGTQQLGRLNSSVETLASNLWIWRTASSPARKPRQSATRVPARDANGQDGSDALPVQPSDTGL